MGPPRDACEGRGVVLTLVPGLERPSTTSSGRGPRILECCVLAPTCVDMVSDASLVGTSLPIRRGGRSAEGAERARLIYRNARRRDRPHNGAESHRPCGEMFVDFIDAARTRDITFVRRRSIGLTPSHVRLSCGTGGDTAVRLSRVSAPVVGVPLFASVVVAGKPGTRATSTAVPQDAQASTGRARPGGGES